MNESDERPERPLHTEADDEPPLSAVEALSMGRQTETYTPSIRPGSQVVYGEADGVETEDQADAHHADEDEHL